jgi:YidC/Oxa1 family membrane protein insertase
MEQKKFEIRYCGFVLIFGILLWIMYQNQPDPAVIAAEGTKEMVVQEAKAKELTRWLPKLQLLSLPLEMLCN